MKKNLKFIIICIFILIVGLSIFGLILFNKKNYFIPDGIPDDYIAVFHGGSGEVTYETYIYKEDTGHANYGFEYINVTSHTKSWGSSEWTHEITKKGKAYWTDDVFPVAEKNGAYEYVTIPNDNKTYTIDEFAGMFLMN